MRKRVRKKLLARYGARTYAGAERAKRRWLLWQHFRRETVAAVREYWLGRIDAAVVDQMDHP